MEPVSIEAGKVLHILISETYQLNKDSPMTEIFLEQLNSNL